VLLPRMRPCCALCVRHGLASSGYAQGPSPLSSKQARKTPQGLEPRENSFGLSEKVALLSEVCRSGNCCGCDGPHVYAASLGPQATPISGLYRSARLSLSRGRKLKNALGFRSFPLFGGYMFCFEQQCRDYADVLRGGVLPAFLRSLPPGEQLCARQGDRLPSNALEPCIQTADGIPFGEVIPVLGLSPYQM